MRVKKFLRTNYETVSPTANLESVKTKLLQEKALVVKDNHTFYGILTPPDVLKKAHSSAIECLTQKQKVDLNQTVRESLDIMAQNNYEVIEVFDKQNFVGLLYKNDIIDYLFDSNKEKDNVIHDMAHDLKNPIASIEGMVDLIKFTNDEREEGKYLDYIHQACQEANNLIGNLLELASVEYEVTQGFETVNIISFLKEYIQTLYYLAEKKNIAIQPHVPSESYMVNLHPKHFKRALQNIITNSIKFSHPGDTVTLDTKFHDHSIIISVKDQGIGIPKDLQSEVFKKFSRARRKGTGGEKSTGLGMAITEEIVKAHNGKIWLESEENYGTTFYISLPVITSRVDQVSI